MTRSVLVVLAVLFSIPFHALQALGTSPVTCHISFDDLSFLDECYVQRSGLKTPEERKLELVNGRLAARSTSERLRLCMKATI